MVSDDEANDDDDSFAQVSSKVTKKGEDDDGEDDDGEDEDANMVSDDEANDDDESFAQVSSKVAKKGDGFDGFGAPDPFTQNDDDQVDAGEPNAPETENPNEDANMVSEDEDDSDDDDSFVQVASEAKK